MPEQDLGAEKGSTHRAGRICATINKRRCSTRIYRIHEPKPKQERGVGKSRVRALSACFVSGKTARSTHRVRYTDFLQSNTTREAEKVVSQKKKKNQKKIKKKKSKKKSRYPSPDPCCAPTKIRYNCRTALFKSRSLPQFLFVSQGFIKVLSILNFHVESPIKKTSIISHNRFPVFPFPFVFDASVCLSPESNFVFFGNPPPP